jgi:hypothetical protein
MTLNSTTPLVRLKFLSGSVAPLLPAKGIFNFPLYILSLCFVARTFMYATHTHHNLAPRINSKYFVEFLKIVFVIGITALCFMFFEVWALFWAGASPCPIIRQLL